MLNSHNQQTDIHINYMLTPIVKHLFRRAQNIRMHLSKLSSRLHATSGKVAGSIPDVICIFSNLPHSSGHTMALGFA
jgi:hypothetical protein